MEIRRLISVLIIAAVTVGCVDPVLPPEPNPPTPVTPDDPVPDPDPPPVPSDIPFSQMDTLRIPCLLIEFRDVRFSGDNSSAYFHNLLNVNLQEYFRDNSLGAFTPVFDVFGPVTLDRYRAYYGRDEIKEGVRADAAPEAALAEACRKLDSKIDFSRYDANGDGIIDMALYIYAGYDQSQGGPFEAIWAHHWNLSKSADPALRNVILNGKRLDSYFCASELRGSSGADLSGIGVVSHEFGHALDLPDLYDTDTEGGVKAQDMGNYALMCNGAFNNLGFTPPYLTAQERILLGWMKFEDLTPLIPGHQVLASVKNNTAYFIPTDTEGEYFILEYRDSKGWDAPMPEGLLIYHVDRSSPYIGRWKNWEIPGNGVNDNAAHPCCYVVKSYPGQEDANYVFPGLAGRFSLEPEAWGGSPVPCQLTNIEITPRGLSVYAQFDCGTNVNGYVRNTSGEPIAGATIMLGEAQNAVSDDSGHFFISVPEGESGPFLLDVSAPDYSELSIPVSLDDSRVISVPVTLRGEGEGEIITLSKYDRLLTRGHYSKAGLGAVKFTKEDLEPHVGGLLQEIVFYPYLLSTFQGDIYVTVDIGTQRVLTKKLEMPSYGAYFRNSVDITEEGILIPEGEDMYVGYGSETGNGTFYLGTVYPGEAYNSYWSPFSLEQSVWEPMYLPRPRFYMNLALEVVVSKTALGGGEETPE